MAQHSLFPLTAEQYLDLLERHERAVTAIKRTEAEKAAINKGFKELLDALDEEERRLRAQIREHQEAALPELADVQVEMSPAASRGLEALQEMRAATAEFTTPPEET
jgi:hypothetical protein